MDRLFKDVIEMLRLRHGKKHIKVIETGTIRSETETSKSTLFISEALGAEGDLISVDNNEAHIKVSKKVCKGKKNIKWIKEDSVKYIKRVKSKFHFAYLDSLNDAKHILKEFKAIIYKMEDNSLVVIDNCGIDTEDIAAKKGIDVHKFLKDNEVTSFMIEQHPHGNRMLIHLYEYELGRMRKIS